MTQSPPEIETREGRLGRVAVVRLRPNLDLVQGVEDAARQAGFADAIVRSAVGSLNDATLSIAGKAALHEGPGVEILSLNGEVSGGRARLRGTISTPQQTVHGGSSSAGKTRSASRLNWCCRNGFPADRRTLFLGRAGPVLFEHL